MRRIRLPFGIEVRSLSSEEQNTMTRWERLLASALGGRASNSGKRITPEIAMTASALSAAVALKSSVFASLPAIVYKRTDEGRERAVGHWAYYRLHDEPNSELTAFEFMETLYAWRLLWGVGYFQLNKNAVGSDGNLTLLHPGLVEKERKADGSIGFFYTDPKTNVRKELPAGEIHEIRGLSLDGFLAGRPYEWMREALGLALAAEEYSARFFSQGGHLGGILEYESELSEEAQTKLKKAMADRTGLDPAHMLMILEYGIKYKDRSAKPSESQLIEARKFQVSEIARFVGLPAHLVGDLERATFSNIEEQDLELVKYYLRPDLVRFSQRLGKAVLTEKERRDGYYIEYLVDALLQGDPQKRGEFYKALWSVGVLSGDDIAERENLNRFPGGAQRFVPLNMVPLTQAEQIAGTRALPLPETRAVTNPSAVRHRLSSAYRPIFDDACRRIVRRECVDVRRAADKTLKKGDLAGFVAWCEDYYRGDFSGFVSRQIAPVAASVAEQVVPTCREETGSTEDIALEVSGFIDEFAATVSDRWAASSRGQLQALAEGRDEGGAPYDEVTSRLDGWEGSRAETEGRRTSVETVNAVARFALVAFGVQRFRSVTVGESDCPYCSEMDGRTVGASVPFLSAGDTIDPGGGQTPIVARGPKYHPPYHKGCDCQIQASF